MDFRICGRVRVDLDGEPPPEWRSAKVRGLLGVLLTTTGKTVLTSTLVDWLWGPTEDPHRPPKSLLNHVSRLRTVLRQVNPPCAVEFTEHGYRVEIDRERVDYHRARRLLTAGRAAQRDGDHDQARGLLTEALDLVEQPPLLDLDTPRADAFRRATQNNLVLPLLNGLAESHLGLDEPDATLTLLDELPTDYSLNVTLLKRRIDALRRLHRHDEATDHYLQAYRALRGHGLDDEAADLRAYVQPRPTTVVPSPRPPSDDLPHYRATPHRLPHDPGHLAGRDTLIAALERKTDYGRASKLLILTGTAGIGKTALAVHWAHRDRRRYPGGRLYVDLHGFSREPSLTANDLTRRLLNDFDATTDALGDDHQRRARLSRLLAGRHTLLVFDNLAEPGQINPLLDLVPDALVVVTSRRHHDHLVTHAGAEELHVPTLGNDAIHDWLREVIGPRATNEPEAFDSLVTLSAGMPLALRIIGKYAHDRPRTPLSEIAQILRDEHRLLSAGDASDPEHTSLRASFHLSYQALRRPSQSLFRTLGIHPTPQIPLGAAAAMTDSSRETTRHLLDDLIQANLLEQGHDHYALHGLIHEFATDTAQNTEPAENHNAAHTRLLQWYLNTLDNAVRTIAPHRGPIPALEDPLAVETTEFTDDDDAFRWVLTHRTTLLSLVRTAHHHGHDPYAWRIANLLSDPLKRHGHYSEVLRCLELALSAAQRSNDIQGTAGTLNNLGHVQLMLRDFPNAENHSKRSHTLFQQLQHHQGTAIALHNLAAARLHTQGLDEAHRIYNQALDLAAEHRLNTIRAVTLRRIGHLLLSQGQHHDAGYHFREALALNQDAGNTLGIGQALSDLAELHHQRHDHHATLDYGHQALAAHRRARDYTTRTDTCRILAAAHHAQGHHSQAIEYAREALRVTWDTGDLTQRARALDQLATTLLATGHRDAAIEGWQQANAIHRSLRDPQWITTTERLHTLGVTTT